MVNYLAILACGVLAIVLGSFWYSPAGFGKAWMRELGITQADVEAAKKKGMGMMWKQYAMQLAASIVTAFVLGTMIAYNGVSDVKTGMIFAFWVWLGFYATSSIGSVTWEGRSWIYWAINNGFSLVFLALSAAILVSWN